VINVLVGWFILNYAGRLLSLLSVRLETSRVI
jgi:hypothetical protein